MSIQTQDPRDIPDAECYVVAIDTFLSGWGGAQGLTNMVVLPCDCASEAEAVARYADSRTDTKAVQVVIEKPSARRWPGVLWSIMSPDDAPAWYGRR
jgi:hypothetical protein